jgi:PAS domain S-box-containing protein
VETAIEKLKTDLHFTYLPPFAKFLLEKHLTDFVKEQIRHSRELDLPILKHFGSMSEEELVEFSKKETAELLKWFMDNKSAQQIELSRQRWLKDQLPNISREQVIAEDITGISYVRRQAFLKFIPLFTNDLAEAVKLLAEIDQYIYVSETIFADTYISILLTRLRQREADLLHNQQQYKQAQGIARLGHWSWNLENNILDWTDELYAMYGLDRSKGAVKSEDIRRLNHPDDAEMVQQTMSRSRETHEPYDFHYRIILDDGTMKTLHARGEVLVDGNNRAYKMIGTLQDVTERQSLIEQLQLSEELYKQAQALSHIGNWTWIIRENKVLWSDELYRIYGLDPQAEQISFERYASFIHPDDKEELFNTIQNALLSKAPYELYHRIILADGTIRFLNAKGQVVLDENGQPVRMVGTAQDVTRRMEMERETQESQRFIQKIANATPALITSYNIKTGQYRFISEGLQKILGYDPKIALTEGVQFFINIMHPDDLAATMSKNAQALELANSSLPISENREPIVEFEYRILHVDGQYRWFHTYGTVFDRDAAGHVEHVLNISIDITERKEMETALSQKNVQLQQSNANLEEFAYVASHDLKEPLRKISIFGDRLLSTQYEALGSEGQFYLEKIIDSSRKMQLLINDLLSLSLISGNKSFVRYSLQNILNEVVRTLEHKIEEMGATVHAQPLPEANIIPSQFRQLFQNLISNSMKFVRDGVKPEIDISCRALKQQEAEQYNLPRALNYLELTFRDNGIGFDNIFAGKIFAIFQRLHHKDYEGTGIGLAICKKIVENHGGVIYAAGEPGRGATFTIIIPTSLGWG